MFRVSKGITDRVWLAISQFAEWQCVAD